MIIKKYGIELHRLSYEDIELVRVMRNKSTIREKMFFQKKITKEMQENWFHSINNMHNYFFIIHYRGKKIGLISGKNVDFVSNTAETGIFIWDEEHWYKGVSFRAAFCVIELGLFFFNMKTFSSTVKPDNTLALNFNKQLGFLPIENSLTSFLLTKESYLENSERLKKIVFRNDSRESHERLSIEEISFLNIESQISIYEKLPEKIKANFLKKINFNSWKD